MTRFEGRPLLVPAAVQFSLQGDQVSMKGPKGELKMSLPPGVKLVSEEVEGAKVVKVQAKDKEVSPAFVGLAYRLIENDLKGVTEGYEKRLEINGVGYRWSIAGRVLKLQVGYSHEVNFEIPPELNLSLEKNVLKVEGISKERVGHVASLVRGIKPVEVYKGKGIKYVGEKVLRKVGKKGS